MKLAALLVSSVALVGIAHADLSRGVIAAYRGQIVITKEDLPEGKNDKDTITKINAARVKSLDGKVNDEVTQWSFHYTAFLKTTGSANMKLEFYTKDKNQLSANQSLSGVDPKNAVISGDISISEDEGLTKGKTYVVKLESDKGTVVAETELTFK